MVRAARPPVTSPASVSGLGRRAFYAATSLPGYHSHLRCRYGAGPFAATPLAPLSKAGGAWAFLYREARRLLNVDDGPGDSRVAIAHGQLAGYALG